MPRALACPTCNARLPKGTGPGSAVTCEFCGGHVLVPGEAPAPTAPPAAGPPFARGPVVGSGPWVPPAGSGRVVPVRRRRGVGSGLALLLVLVAGVAALVAALPATSGIREALPFDVPEIDVADLGGPDLGGGIGGPDPELVLGGAGTGAGRFDDAREVGVDGEGLVYVGEFGSKRIQRFSSDGELLGQWTVAEGQPTVPLSGMAVGRDGVVYAQIGFEVYRYRGATGEPLGQLQSTGEGPFDWFDAIAPTADGGLVVVERGGARSDIVWLSREGVETRRLSPPDLQAPGSIDRLVVDGQGRVTGLGRRASTGGLETGLYVVDPDGSFRGFTALEDIGAGTGLAVDGRSELWVSGFGGVRHLDADGRDLDGPGIRGPVYGLVVDDEDRLWVSTGTEVRAYPLP